VRIACLRGADLSGGLSGGLSALLLTLPLVGACGPSADFVAAERPAIERLLADYAGRMAEAYRTGDATPLAEVATERETLRVATQIESLASEGKQLRVELLRQAIESVDVYRRTGATVQTLETWRLEVVALGSEAVLSQSPEQENRVVYSLVREEGRWRILSRILKQTSEP